MAKNLIRKIISLLITLLVIYIFPRISLNPIFVSFNPIFNAVLEGVLKSAAVVISPFFHSPYPLMDALAAGFIVMMLLIIVPATLIYLLIDKLLEKIIG